MKKSLPILMATLIMATQLHAQLESAAGNWKTRFISSGEEYRLPSPPSYKEEIAEVISRQQDLDSAGWQQFCTGMPVHQVTAGKK